MPASLSRWAHRAGWGNRSSTPPHTDTLDAERPSRMESERAFDELLTFLKRQRGFDFSGYKRTGLMRRIRKRMHVAGVEEFDAYRDFLEVHPEEFVHLFNTILINVTSFFRDPETWQSLAETVIPQVVARKPGGEPIRIWCAGCSTGQEAYTLVMLFAEALGWERFKEQVKLYATDADDEALALARQASYTAKEMETVPPELRQKYFEPVGQRYVFRPELRRLVVFGRHDLSNDAPISHLDLLTCRNTLMYFNAEMQLRVLTRLHFALDHDGYLFLGRAEMLLARSNLFVPLDLKARIFARVPNANLRDRLLLAAQDGERDRPPRAVEPPTPLHELALDHMPVAQIVVDTLGSVVLANTQARTLFRLDTRDVGRPFKDLEVSYRPVELRSRIEQALSELRPIYVGEVEYPFPGGAVHFLDVQVTPLFAPGGALRGVSITFQDMTRYRRLQADLHRANQELETAYEELQATNEELETTNEELQSTVEELQTTNEELHSTNEELETMNEELHSTNEELETINEELRRRTDELNRVNSYLESILSSLQAGAVVLDRELYVQLWNAGAEDLWGVRAAEVEGMEFLALDSGLPVAALEAPIRSCLTRAVSTEVQLSATNRRGRPFTCRVTCTPLRQAEGRIWGVILLMEEWTSASVEEP